MKEKEITELIFEGKVYSLKEPIHLKNSLSSSKLGEAIAKQRGVIIRSAPLSEILRTPNADATTIAPVIKKHYKHLKKSSLDVYIRQYADYVRKFSGNKEYEHISEENRERVLNVLSRVKMSFNEVLKEIDFTPVKTLNIIKELISEGKVESTLEDGLISYRLVGGGDG